LDAIVDVKQHISEITHRHNILKFWVKMWYKSHLWGFSYPNMMIQLIACSRRNCEHYDELLS